MVGVSRMTTAPERGRFILDVGPRGSVPMSGTRQRSDMSRVERIAKG